MPEEEGFLGESKIEEEFGSSIQPTPKNVLEAITQFGLNTKTYEPPVITKREFLTG